MSQPVSIRPWPDKQGNLTVTLSDPQLEEVEKRKEQLNLDSRSEALRYFIQIGMHSVIENDPRNHEGSPTTDTGPMIRDFVPEGKENSIPLVDSDGQETLVDLIEKSLIDIVDEDPQINRDGWDVHK